MTHSASKALTALLGLLLAVALAPAPAGAAFGLKEVDTAFVGADGSIVAQAGAHPYAFETTIAVNATIDPESGLEVPDGEVKTLHVHLPEGIAGIPTAVPRCGAVQFVARNPGSDEFPACADATAIGEVALVWGFGKAESAETAVYNLVPSPGNVAKFGFWGPNGLPVTVDLALSAKAPYHVVASVRNITQAAYFYASVLSVWGNPASPVHDDRRGLCIVPGEGDDCSASVPEAAYLTLPRSCRGPLPTLFEADSWQDPSTWVSATATTHDDSIPPSPLGMSGCERLGFSPSFSAQPTSRAGASASGLEVALELRDEGFADPEGIAAADIERAVLRLPEGMTLNPSQAEGLATCSPAQLARESATSQFGTGCPAASRVGSVEVQTPQLPGETLRGSLFVATPYENPFSSLIALYMTIQDPELGIGVVLPGRVDPDPRTGQLTTSFANLPEVPVSSFAVRLAPGSRSPLITPRGCGAHTAALELTPSSGEPPISANSQFTIDAGPQGRPCEGGPAPFEPGFSGGTLDNAAGAHSPLQMRFTRRDGDQDLTRVSAAFPPGLSAILAGVGRCPDAAIAAARARSGREEQASPSCPDSSRIGSVLAGAGVGSELTYVPGSIYLAGPLNGAPLSAVAIVPAVAGPFDVGTVVTRFALRIDPRSAEVSVDGAASDPIPHILAGIPLAVRDVRASVDRPGFTLNPTSCEPARLRATVWGGGEDVFSSLDDAPHFLAERFQAASCASLGFRPRLALRLRGGTRRSAFPALRAVVTPRPGEANFSRAVVTLPRSAFLEQGHIRTICTRVQFAAGPGNGALCPKGAQYGYARAWSPLLDAPAQGPVYLRSSDNKLPDLVVALKGPASVPVEVELSARIDSVRGGIRSTFAAIPDLPVSRFILDMQGGRKGLIVNSRNLCFKPKRNRAKANLRGQNGRFAKTSPRAVATACQKRRAKPSARHARGAGS